MKCSKTSWYTAALTLDLRKHSGPTPADDMAASQTVETSHWTSRNMDSVPLHSSSRLWDLDFQIKYKMYFHLKRGLWTTPVQLFFSLAQIRCFWRCFCFRSVLVSLFLKMSERGDSWCTDSSFSSLLVKQVFESALLDSILKLAVVPVALCTFSYPISSFQSTLHLICFDTALLEEPPLSVMTLCDLLSSWRCQWSSSGLMPSQQCSPWLWFQRTRDTRNLYCMNGHLLKLKCKYSNILRYWIFDFHEL